MTAAEELRAAATLMRERAAAAPAGPWHPEGRHPGRVIAADKSVVASPASEYIASWHPGVTVAAAELLEVVAGKAEFAAARGWRANTQVTAALKLARAYLGTTGEPGGV